MKQGQEVMTERNLRTPDHFYRDMFASRIRHELTRETHVVVGDHTPERRNHHHPHRVMLDGERFTVDYATNDAFGGEKGVLYYSFVERPGDLFAAARCIPFSNFDPSDNPKWDHHG